MIYKAYKNIGENMLQAMQRFSDEHGIDLKKATFAGRLDPLAKGLFLILTEQDKFKKEKLNAMDKKYKFFILFSVATDSLDILGFIKKHNQNFELNIQSLQDAVDSFNGIDVEWHYPCFSSKKVGGKALFEWYLENQCKEIDVPKYKSRIYKLELKSTFKFSRQELRNLIFDRLNFLQNSDINFAYNDYRKLEIAQKWSTFFNNFASDYYHVAEFEAIVAKSLYIRTLAAKIGDKLNCPTFAFDIERISFGKFIRFADKGFFWRKY